jgi:hypothetical protein
MLPQSSRAFYRRLARCIIKETGEGVRLSIEQVEKFGVGQSGLADDAFDDVFGQIKPLVVGNRNASGLARVFEVHVRSGLLVYKKPPFCKARITARGFRLANFGGIPA